MCIKYMYENERKISLKTYATFRMNRHIIMHFLIISLNLRNFNMKTHIIMKKTYILIHFNNLLKTNVIFRLKRHIISYIRKVNPELQWLTQKFAKVHHKSLLLPMHGFIIVAMVHHQRLSSPTTSMNYKYIIL